MPKKKDDIDELDVAVEREEQSAVPIYSIDSFVEENVKTRSSASAAAFRMWYQMREKCSTLDKRSVSDWNALLDQFLTEEVK